MNFFKDKLKKPIIFFDLESTGIDTRYARIVSIAMVKIEPGDTRTKKYYLINPGIPIPQEATEVHGISDEDVKDQPTFRTLSGVLFSFMEGCDVAGFNNNKYDNPLLYKEFHRCGLIFPHEECHSIDIMSIYHQMEPRDLSAAHKFYTGKKMIGAHNAQADCDATVDIFEKQLERYSESFKDADIEFLDKFSRRTPGAVDWAGYIILHEDGEYHINIGQRKGPIRGREKSLQWILTGDFPEQTKIILMEILRKLSLEKIQQPGTRTDQDRGFL